MNDSLDQLRTTLHDFAADRDWQRFHTPKNLAMALSSEVGELVAELQWHDSAQELDEGLRRRLGAEAADVLIYLVRLADVAPGLDLIAEATSKIALNHERYPVDQAYGNSTKYSRYPPGT